MILSEYIKNYLTSKSQKNHGFLVKKLSLEIFDQIKNIFNLKKYDNPNDLKILEYSAILHDIGVNLEKSTDKPHNKISRDLILRNGIDDLDNKDVLIAANIVRYHRKKPPSEKHKYYCKLSDEEKNKVKIFSSIVRLADALDSEHFSIIDGINLSFNESSRILTLNLHINIMLNIELKEVLDKKKKLFEETFDVKIVIK